MIKSGAKRTKEPWRDNYITPAYILDRVSNVLGDLWYDPCPRHPEFDELQMSWPQDCFINPPFSKYLQWVRHGLAQPPAQVWLCINSTETEWCRLLIAHCNVMCLTDHRIKFIDPRTMTEAANPERANIIFYRSRNLTGRSRFVSEFSSIGTIINLT